MSISLGIDYKKGTISLSLLNGEDRQCFNLAYSHDTIGKGIFVLKFTEMLKVWQPDIIIIERPLQTRFPGSDRAMIEIASMVEVACGIAAETANIDYEVMMIMPSAWRKNIFGTSKVGKKEALEHTGLTDHNLAEATCMAEYGMKILKERQLVAIYES